MSKKNIKLNIIDLPIDSNQYFKETYIKKQIVLHHTVSGDSAKSVIQAWNSNVTRVATAFIINRNGLIYKCFEERYWAHHLGTKKSNNRRLNQQSIGIELCNWGPLNIKDDKFYNVYGHQVPSEQVIDYGFPFRSHRFYHKYSLKQLEALKVLLESLCLEHNIPMNYHLEMWELSKDALNEKEGIWSHVSFRSDKSDCHPQRELIQMLRNLEKIKLQNKAKD